MNHQWQVYLYRIIAEALINIGTALNGAASQMEADAQAEGQQAPQAPVQPVAPT